MEAWITQGFSLLLVTQQHLVIRFAGGQHFVYTEAGGELLPNQLPAVALLRAKSCNSNATNAPSANTISTTP